MITQIYKKITVSGEVMVHVQSFFFYFLVYVYWAIGITKEHLNVSTLAVPVKTEITTHSILISPVAVHTLPPSGCE